MSRLSSALLMTLLALWACQEESPVVVKRSGEPAVVRVADEDADMRAAIAQARASLAGFIERLPELRAQGAYVAVKVPLLSEDETDHVWLNQPELSEDSFRGLLGNVPLAGSHELGEELTVPTTGISDWMAVVDGELYGGFTLLVARTRMSEEDREEFDDLIDFALPPSPRTF